MYPCIFNIDICIIIHATQIKIRFYFYQFFLININFQQTINDRNVVQAECERLKIENMKLSNDLEKNVQDIRNAFKSEQFKV